MVVLKIEHIVLMFLICILVAPLAAALETRITVSTYADHDVEVKILDPYKDDNDLIESFSNNTGGDGEITFTHISSRNRISIAVIIRKDGKIKKINDKSIYLIENHEAGNPRFIELVEGVGVIETTANDTVANETAANETTANETATNETDTNETTLIENSTLTAESETQESTQGLAGQTIGEDSENISFSGKIFFIVIIGIAAALLVFLVVFKGNLLKRASGGEIRNELSGKRESGAASIPPDKASAELLDAEKKIQEAQEEIRMIKNRKGKIEEAKERLKEARKEVEKLEKDDD